MADLLMKPISPDIGRQDSAYEGTMNIDIRLFGDCDCQSPSASRSPNHQLVKFPTEAAAIAIMLMLSLTARRGQPHPRNFCYAHLLSRPI